MKDYSDYTRLGQSQATNTMSNQQLYQLTNNHQKFMYTVQCLNNQGKACLEQDKAKQALVYIVEAEKVLEYAASRGKNIDRTVIFCVLQNEACCYQKLWELDKCCSYLEALIFNISEHLRSVDTSSRSESLPEESKKMSPISQLVIKELEGKSIQKRIQLSKVKLQYCAINSQLRNHHKAYSSGIKVLKIMKTIFKELQKTIPYFQNNTLNQSYIETQIKIKLITGISLLNDEPLLNRINDYIMTAQYYLWKWNIRKLQESNHSAKEYFKHFSIGNVMQIRPKQLEYFNQKEESMEDEEMYESVKRYTYVDVLNKALLLSVSYFTVATELRLLAMEQYRRKQFQRKEDCREFQQSQVYHLISLIIICVYVPYDMMYVRHLLSSFSNHYGVDIGNDGECNFNSPNVMKERFDPLKFVDFKKQLTHQREQRKMENLALQIKDSIRISEGSDVKKEKRKKKPRESPKPSVSSKSRSKGNRKSKKSSKEKQSENRFMKATESVKHRKIKSEFNKKDPYSPTYTERRSPNNTASSKYNLIKFARHSKTMKNSRWQDSYECQETREEYFRSRPKASSKKKQEKKSFKRMVSPTVKINKNKPKAATTSKKQKQNSKQHILIKEEGKASIIKNIDNYYF